MPVVMGQEWTFNTQAELYEKMRPGYPKALYDDLFHLAPIDCSSTVVEIGIGGGQATKPVLDTGCTLTAIEYGDRFAELCRAKFRQYPSFSVINARFEDCPWESQTCDLIFSASAFHWIPEEIGYAKVFDMLKSGGVFARFANHPYKDKGREQLHQDIQKVYAVYMPGSKPPAAEYSEAQAQVRAEIALKYGFTSISWKLYHRTRTFTAQEYALLLGTYSDHIAIEENTRKKFFSEIETVINDHGGELTLYDTIDLQLAQKP